MHDRVLVPSDARVRPFAARVDARGSLCSLETPRVIVVAPQGASHASRNAARERASRDGRGGRANGGTGARTVAGRRGVKSFFPRAHRARFEGVPEHARPVALRGAERALRELQTNSRSFDLPGRVEHARLAAAGAEAQAKRLVFLPRRQNRRGGSETSSRGEENLRARSAPRDAVARVVRVAPSVAADEARFEIRLVLLRRERFRDSRPLGTVGIVLGVVLGVVLEALVEALVVAKVVVAKRTSLSAARVQRGALGARRRGASRRLADARANAPIANDACVSIADFTLAGGLASGLSQSARSSAMVSQAPSRGARGRFSTPTKRGCASRRTTRVRGASAPSPPSAHTAQNHRFLGTPRKPRHARWPPFGHPSHSTNALSPEPSPHHAHGMSSKRTIASASRAASIRRRVLAASSASPSGGAETKDAANRW